MPTERNRFYSAPPAIHNIAVGYVWSETAVITGMTPPVTGAWIPSTAATDGSTTVSFVQSSTVSNSTPSGLFTGLALQTGIALTGNPSRKAWFIANTSSVSPLYVTYGNGPTTSTNFNFILNTAASAGFQGGSWSDSPAQYTGPVSVSGLSFVAWQL